jgi:hypothetical protein
MANEEELLCEPKRVERPLDQWAQISRRHGCHVASQGKVADWLVHCRRSVTMGQQAVGQAVIQQHLHVHVAHVHHAQGCSPKTWRRAICELEPSRSHHQCPVLEVPWEPLVEVRELVALAHAELLSVQ